MFFGSEGWLEISGSTWKAFRRREREPFAGSKDGDREGSHWANFLEAMRAGKDETLHGDIHEGHSRHRCATSPTSRTASVAR